MTDRDPSNGQYVRIGIQEVYRKLEQMEERIAVNHHALTREMAEIKRENQELVNDNKDLKERVRALELRFYGILAGILAAGISIWAASNGLGGA